MTLIMLSCSDFFNKDWPHLLSLPRQHSARPSVKLTEHGHCYIGQTGTWSGRTTLKSPGTAPPLLHPPLHGHGADVPPAPVQAPGGLLDGVALGLVGAGIRVMQEDVTDVKHRLHPCAVLLNVSLQVLQQQERRRHCEVEVAVEGLALKEPPPSSLGDTVLRVFPPGTLQYRPSHLCATPVLQHLTGGLSVGNQGIEGVELGEGGKGMGVPFPDSPPPQTLGWLSIYSTPSNLKGLQFRFGFREVFLGKLS